MSPKTDQQLEAADELARLVRRIYIEGTSSVLFNEIEDALEEYEESRGLK